MNHQNVLNSTARIELPSAIGEPRTPRPEARFVRKLSPAVSAFMGLVGFVCCGAAVITAASLLALQIH